LTVQISPACWDTTAIDSFYAEIKKNYGPGQAILLVSHSNIIPYLLMRAGLPTACRREMRFANAPDASGWWVIEGFDNLWRIEAAGSARKNCSDFKRLRY